MRLLFRSAVVAIATLLAMPALAGEAKVTFVHINDVYKFDGGKRGGMARIAAVIRAERAKAGPVIVTHGGDFLSPSLMSGFDQGLHMVELMNMTPLDVFVPGNHEFDHGPEIFARRMGQLKGAKLAANLRAPDGSRAEGFADSQMMKVGDITLGLVGGALDTTPSLSQSGGYRFAPGVETVVAEAKALRSKGADFVVAVVHFTSEDNRRLVDSGAVDLILGGHNHDLTAFFNGRTALIESKEEGEFVTAVDAAITTQEVEGRKVMSWWPNIRIQDTASVTPDPEVQVMVSRLKDDLAIEMDVPLGTLKGAFDSRKALVRSQETAMGNLIADAMREAVSADIALTNGGGIRGNREYPPGHAFTRRDVLAELPFGNKTALLAVTGADLKAVLEHGVAQIEHQAGRMPQVSGLAFSVERAKAPGERVSGVVVGGKPLDSAATYRLATSDFLARGGDGYTMLTRARPLLDDRDGQPVANDVMVFVKASGTVTTGIEGRIILK